MRRLVWPALVLAAAALAQEQRFANLALGDGVSSSPSNSKLQPRLRFPKFSIRDMVNSQHRLVAEALGLKRLRAVVGISMGGMQTFQWAVSYPEFVERAIPVVGSPRLTSYDLLLWRAEMQAIASACTPAAGMRAVADIHALNYSRVRSGQLGAATGGDDGPRCGGRGAA